MEGGVICLHWTDVLKKQLVTSGRCFHLNVKGEHRQANFLFVWCPVLVVYRFLLTSVFCLFLNLVLRHFQFCGSFHFDALMSISSLRAACGGL